jgi:hypothetical protein
MTATVIIPTTGAIEVYDAIKSVLDQTYSTICYVVCDGQMFLEATRNVLEKFHNHPNLKNLKLATIPINTGSNNFCGHRIYASFPHLVNTEYILFLDQDNWFACDHVKKAVNLMDQNKLDWCYALRNITTKEGNFICRDDCESLGRWETYIGANLVDTNCYILKTEIAIRIAHVWHGKSGTDRIFTKFLMKHFPNYECTGFYSVNYRLGSRPRSVKKEFFEKGNAIMAKKYGNQFPWSRL